MVMRTYVFIALALSIVWISDDVLAVLRSSGQPALARMIIGKWCDPDLDGGPCLAHEEYRQDGTFVSCGWFEKSSPQLFKGKATYTVNANDVCFVVTESNDPIGLPVGDAWCARVLEIQDGFFRYRNDGSPTVHTSYRLPSSAPECPSRK
jgi:hypothetical protein